MEQTEANYIKNPLGVGVGTRKETQQKHNVAPSKQMNTLRKETREETTYEV